VESLVLKHSQPKLSGSGGIVGGSTRADVSFFFAFCEGEVALVECAAAGFSTAAALINIGEMRSMKHFSFQRFKLYSLGENLTSIGESFKRIKISKQKGLRKFKVYFSR
jgi:hypothetical protein